MSEENDIDNTTSELLNHIENNRYLNHDNDDNDNDDDNDEYEDDDDDDDEDELLIMEEKADSNKPHRYVNPLCKPVFKAGGIEIGLSQAKLFGLLDENGNIILKKPGGQVQQSKTEVRNRINNMSKPRETTIEVNEDEEETWKPSKSKEAQHAMKNARCGYDFIDRLNDRGDFLDRLNISSSGISKAAKAQAEADYEARLDKLACPTCKKVQSFTEFFENKRECGLCKERFTKLKTFNASSFEERMKKAAAKKEEKLAEIEKKAYSAPIFKAKLPPGGLSESKKDKEEKEVVEKKVIPRKEAPKPEKKIVVVDRENQRNVNRKKLEESPKLLEALPLTAGKPPIDLLKKLAAIQHEQSTLLRETLQLAEKKNVKKEKQHQEKEEEVNDNEPRKEVDPIKAKFSALLDVDNF